MRKSALAGLLLTLLLPATAFALIAATFLGAPYILLTRGHVNVDVLPLLVQQPARRKLHFIGSVGALAFCALFLWASVPWWYETWKLGQTTSSIWRARHTIVPEPVRWPLYQPLSIGPTDRAMAGMFTVAAAIRQAGVVLSQPVVSTTPSRG